MYRERDRHLQREGHDGGELLGLAEVAGVNNILRPIVNLIIYDSGI